MKVEQFVLAYAVEQDRVRALLPEGFHSLRPVLRINTEIHDERSVYLELNAPVEYNGQRGWLNIANWTDGELSFYREGKTTIIESPFFWLQYTAIGIEGGCPAEKDNCGCFFAENDGCHLRPAETITEKKEFCDAEFAWRFHEGDAHGKSLRETLPAFDTPAAKVYPRQPLSAENAAMIPCQKVLGTYIVRFERN